jgi:hypothetical protein
MGVASALECAERQKLPLQNVRVAEPQKSYEDCEDLRAFHLGRICRRCNPDTTIPYCVEGRIIFLFLQEQNEQQTEEDS